MDSHEQKGALSREGVIDFLFRALHEHRSRSSLPSPFPSSLESDAAGFWRGLRHQFTNGFEDDLKLAIVLLFQICEASGKDFVRTDHLAQANKGTHNSDVYLNGTLASQHAG